MAIRRTRFQWQQLITAQQASGLSQKAFCQQEGLAMATFGYWKRKLQQVDAAQAEKEAIGTVPDPWIELPATGSTVGAGWQVELDLGNGVCLRLTQAG